MFYLFCASFVWAYSYGLIKSELNSIDASIATVCRLFVAFLVFLPFLIIKKNKKLIPFLIFIGAIQYGVMYLFLLNSYQYLQAYQVALFSAMTPFYIILIDSCAEHQFNFAHFMVAGVAIVGFSTLYNIQAINKDTQWGFFLVQCADACFAFGQMAYRRLKQTNVDIQDKEIYGFLFLGGLFTAVTFTSFIHGWYSLHDITLRQAGVLIYLGAVASGLCFFWWNKGIIQLHPAMISVFNNLKLILAILVSIFCFHEKMNPKIHLSYCLFLMALAFGIAQYYQYHYKLNK